mgnify:CR=1 FL=1
MPGLYGLVVDILCVEAGLHKNDGYYIDEIVKPIFLALEKTNFSPNQVIFCLIIYRY